MRINEKNFLEGSVRWERSPNHSGLLIGGQPDTIVIHYTGGSTIDGAVSTLINERNSASAHLVIGRKGELVQLVPFDTIAWHAGISHHEETKRSGLNKYSIGIELVNAGPLEMLDEHRFVSWFRKIYSSEDVIKATHKNEYKARFWHLFSETQLSKCMEVCRLLKESYPIEYILGHDDISPGRKVDPGPAFPMERFREKLLFLGRDDESDDLKKSQKGETAFVNTHYLNIREGAHFKYNKVSDPLKMGSEVQILSSDGKWCHVKVRDEKFEIVGWVNGKYLSKVENQA